MSDVLTRFKLAKGWIAVGGGRKFKVSEWIDGALLAHGWKPKNFDTKISVDAESFESPTHEVDCFKNRIALEIEWNNKDPWADQSAPIASMTARSRARIFCCRAAPSTLPPPFSRM